MITHSDRTNITLECQGKRRNEIYALHVELNRHNFSDEGHWIGHDWGRGVGFSREMLWHSIAFLAGDENDIRLGNAIIRNTPNDPNHFNLITAVELLLQYDRSQIGIASCR